LKLKKRKDNSKKGDNGKVLVIAGSLDYTGSAYLCSKAIATLRCGCDIVYVACPEKVAWALNSMSPDLITIKLKGDYLNLSHFEILKKTAKKCDVILIGPGISQKPQTKKLILKMIKEIIKLQKPIVIDADALKMIKLQDVENSILTPHQKEFEILIKNSKLNENNFREEIKKDREKLFEYGRINIKPYIEDLKHELESGTKNPGGNASAENRASSGENSFDFELESLRKTFSTSELHNHSCANSFSCNDKGNID